MARALREVEAAKAAPHSDLYHSILRHVFYPAHPYMPALRSMKPFSKLRREHRHVSSRWHWWQTLRARTSWLLHPHEARPGPDSDPKPSTAGGRRCARGPPGSSTRMRRALALTLTLNPQPLVADAARAEIQAPPPA